MRNRLAAMSTAFLTAAFLQGLAAGAQSEAAGPVPEPLSPGSLTSAVPSESGCPTFSWGLVDGAKELELVVVSLLEGAPPSVAGEPPPSFVLRQRLPGVATSWTPSADRCLEPGGYAWLIRAWVREAKPSPWSPARLLSVAAPKPLESLEQLVSELRELLAAAQTDPEIADALRTLIGEEILGYPESLGRLASLPVAGFSAAVDQEPPTILEPDLAALVVRQESSAGTVMAAVDGRILGNTGGPAQFGVYGRTVTNLGSGVRGEGEYAAGVVGASQFYDGVQGITSGGSSNPAGVRGGASAAGAYGGFFYNLANGVALEARGFGQARDKATLRVQSLQTNMGMATYMSNNSTFATGHFGNQGSGQVLWLQNGATNNAGSGGGDFIVGVPFAETDAQFRILTTGEMRSDVGFNTPSGDFAEMLPAVDGLAAGDVLIIGEDGRLELSRRAYEARVAGVYSTRPGFTGGLPVDGPIEGQIPLAIVGIVPVKASAEGGEIRPGDLLVTARTPGRVMRARRVRRNGVVVGKALSGLVSGTGEIRMLVMLQ